MTNETKNQAAELELAPELSPEEQLKNTAEEEAALKSLNVLFQENQDLKEENASVKAQLELLAKAAQEADERAAKAKADLEGGAQQIERQSAALAQKETAFAELASKLEKSEKKARDLEKERDEHALNLSKLDSEKFAQGLEAQAALKAVDDHKMHAKNCEAESKGLKYELKRIAVLVQGGAIYGNRDSIENDELTSLVDGAAGRKLEDE